MPIYVNHPVSVRKTFTVGPTALFDDMQVILFLIRERDSISLLTNKHFHPTAIKKREVWGGYSIIMHYFFLSSRLRSHFGVDLHVPRQHKQKSCESEYQFL